MIAKKKVLEHLEQLGFVVNPKRKLAKSVDEIWDFIQEVGQERELPLRYRWGGNQG